MQVVCDNKYVMLEVAPNHSRTLIEEPTNCPSCGSPTTRLVRGKPGAVTYCTNPANCPAVLLAKIKHWIGGSKKGVGILDIGDTMIKALCDNGLLRDPSDLYTLTVSDLENISLNGGGRIGTSRATTIVQNIAAKKHLPLHIFLGSLGIDLLGRRRVQILQKDAAGQLDSLEDWLDTEKFRRIQIRGLGETTKESIISGIETYRPLIERLLEKGVTVTDKKTATETITENTAENGAENGAENTSNGKLSLAGLSFCLTGTRECSKEIEALGGELKSGVSKTLNYLVQKDPTSRSSKTIKAEQYGVRIISIDYLKDVLAGKATLD